MSFISKQENYLIDGKEEQKFQKHKDSIMKNSCIQDTQKCFFKKPSMCFGP